MSTGPPKLLTVREVARRWAVSRSLVYAMVAAGLPHVRIGLGRGTIRINEEDAEKHLAGRRRDDSRFAEHFA